MSPKDNSEKPDTSQALGAVEIGEGLLRLSRQFEVWAKGINAMPEMKRIAEVQKGLLNLSHLRITQEIIERFQRAHQAQLSVWNRVFKDLPTNLQEIVKRTEEHKRAIEGALDAFAADGWILFETISTVDVIQLSTLAKHDKQKAEQELVRYFSGDRLDSLLGRVTSSTLFAPWQSKYHRALEAHKKGHHDLSIPIWLISLNGVLAELGTGRRYKAFSSSIDAKTHLKRFQNIVNDTTDDAYIRATADLLHAMGRNAAKISNNPIVNRHRILHGLDPNYGTEKDSIQCVLVLHALQGLSESGVVGAEAS